MRHMIFILFYPNEQHGRGRALPDFLFCSLIQQTTSRFDHRVVCVYCHPIYFGRQVVDVPAGVTQEKGHTRFLHLPSAVLAFIFLARRIQSFLSLVDREVEFCVPTN